MSSVGIQHICRAAVRLFIKFSEFRLIFRPYPFVVSFSLPKATVNKQLTAQNWFRSTVRQSQHARAGRQQMKIYAGNQHVQMAAASWIALLVCHERRANGRRRRETESLARSATASTSIFTRQRGLRHNELTD